MTNRTTQGSTVTDASYEDIRHASQDLCGLLGGRNLVSCTSIVTFLHMPQSGLSYVARASIEMLGMMYV